MVFFFFFFFFEVFFYEVWERVGVDDGKEGRKERKEGRKRRGVGWWPFYLDTTRVK